MIVLHAHNYGHNNLGDDAMAVNVYSKLARISSTIYTISTYVPPHNADLNKDNPSLTKIVHNYENPLVKLFLVACSRLKLQWILHAYILIVCNWFLFAAHIYKWFGVIILLDSKKTLFLRLLKSADIYVRSGSGSLNDIWYIHSLIPQYYEARVCKLFKTKVVFTGQGIGPITKDSRQRLLAKFVTLMDYLTLRDMGFSQMLLANLGVDMRKIKTIGDDAFDLDSEMIELSLSGVLVPERSTIIFLQFRPTNYELEYSIAFWHRK